MPFVGSIIPQKSLGLAQQERRVRRANDDRREDPAGARTQRAGDETEISAPDAVGSTQASDRPEGNDTERAREDHEANLVGGAYTPPNRKRTLQRVAAAPELARRAATPPDTPRRDDQQRTGDRPPPAPPHIDIEA
jgi:hypothetical protein